MPALQEKLDRLNDNPNAQILKYLQSHPLSIERVSNTRNFARTLGNQGRENSSYLYAREKIRALTRRVGKTATPTLNNPVVKNYATAMNLYYQGKINQSYNLVTQLPQQQVAARLALATLLNDKGEYQQVFNLLSHAVDVKPSDTALLVPLSNALLGLGRAKEAWQRLRRVVPSEQTSLRFFELKQEVARRLGYHADAYIAAAERNVRLGEYHHAILQLKQAQKLPSITANGRAKVTAKLNQIEAQYGQQDDK
jgi:predicted Zn-dependent protease